MKEIELTVWTVQNSSTAEKLGVFALLALFAGIIYVILPKVMEKRLRGYHDQSDLIEEEEGKEQEEKN